MNLTRKSQLLLVLMCTAVALASALRPTTKVADEEPPIDLTGLIPRNFGDWHEEVQNAIYVVNPQQKEFIEKIYSQTLSRTYANTSGYRIMLSVAYGGDQSRATQVHKPEVCYPAQGFQLLSKTAATIASPFGPIAVARVDTRLGQRREPITYWITIGDRIVQDSIQKKLVEMRYRFAGRIPDGLLFRVSSIDPEISRAYDFHDNYINQLLNALTSEKRQRLVGSFGKN